MAAFGENFGLAITLIEGKKCPVITPDIVIFDGQFLDHINETRVADFLKVLEAQVIDGAECRQIF